MLEKWRKHLDKGRKCSALSIDLSKAFDNLQHEFLLTKVNTFKFSYKSFKLVSSFYLKEDIKLRLIQNKVIGKIY